MLSSACGVAVAAPGTSGAASVPSTAWAPPVSAVVASTSALHRQTEVVRRQIDDRQPDVVAARQRIVGPRLRPGADRAQGAGQLDGPGVLRRGPASARRTCTPGGGAARRTRRAARWRAPCRAACGQRHRGLHGGALSRVRGEHPVQVVAGGRARPWPAGPARSRSPYGRRCRPRSARLPSASALGARARGRAVGDGGPRQAEQPAPASSAAVSIRRVRISWSSRRRRASGRSSPTTRPATQPGEHQYAQQPPAAAEAEGGHVGRRRRGRPPRRRSARPAGPAWS